VQLWQAIAHAEVEQLPPFARLTEELGYAGVTSGGHVAKAG